MELITQEQRRQMLENWRTSEKFDCGGGIAPVVKLFSPFGAATWLLSELDPEDPDTAFGLCDLGFGEPELGYVSLAELRSLGPLVARDLYFTATKTLEQYADEARAKGRIDA